MTDPICSAKSKTAWNVRTKESYAQERERYKMKKQSLLKKPFPRSFSSASIFVHIFVLPVFGLRPTALRTAWVVVGFVYVRYLSTGRSLAKLFITYPLSPYSIR